MKRFSDPLAIWVSIGFKLFPYIGTSADGLPHIRTGAVVHMAAQILGIVMMWHSAVVHG